MPMETVCACIPGTNQPNPQTPFLVPVMLLNRYETPCGGALVRKFAPDMPDVICFISQFGIKFFRFHSKRSILVTDPNIPEFTYKETTGVLCDAWSDAGEKETAVQSAGDGRESASAERESALL